MKYKDFCISWPVESVLAIGLIRRYGHVGGLVFAHVSGQKLKEITLLRDRYFLVLESTLRGRNLMRVDTPSLYAANAGEPTIKPLRTEIRFAGSKEPRLLVTSPELWHKRLIMSGLRDIYEIKTCYRDDENTPQHACEFAMLEWYRVEKPLVNLWADIEAIVSACFAAGIFLGEFKNFKYLRMQDVFKFAADVDLPPETELEFWQDVAQKKKLRMPGNLSDGKDAWMWFFVDQVEPWIKTQSATPLIIADFPPAHAALAKIQPSGWAARFELYWRGLEIANGYDELCDPDEQRARLLADQKVVDWPVDVEFAQELKAGMPPCVGCALGVDRLLMAGRNVSEISDVRYY